MFEKLKSKLTEPTESVQRTIGGLQEQLAEIIQEKAKLEKALENVTEQRDVARQSEAAIQKELDELSTDPSILSPRELELARLMATEMTFDEIAEKMGVKHHTARTYRKNIYSKLGIHSRVTLRKIMKKHDTPAICSICQGVLDNWEDDAETIHE